jgi:hypothetical protein
MGESSRLSSVEVSWGWKRVTPAGPEMKMLMLIEEEDLLHLVELRLAACELQMATRHELNVYSCCEDPVVNGYLTQQASMKSDDVASHLIVMVSQGMLETRRVAKCAAGGV